MKRIQNTANIKIDQAQYFEKNMDPEIRKFAACEIL